MADSLSIQIAAPAAATEQLAAAAHDHDEKKLQRALVGGGVGKTAAALFLACFRKPGGVFLDGAELRYAYYGTLLAVAVFGAAEVAAGFWVTGGDPARSRGGKGKRMLYASVVPLVLVAGLGGFAVLK